jgi:hypothetical protein
MNFSDWMQSENWHGVYCGPGPRLMPKSCDALHNGESLPPPIDPVDAACKDHDIAYCKAGKDWRAALPFSASRDPSVTAADKEFADTVSMLLNNKSLSGPAKRFARLIVAYFGGRVQ